MAKPSSPDDPDAASKPKMDRRSGEDRRKGERRKRQVPVPVERRKGERRAATPRRRRSMNQYDMDDEVLAFINAINRFKERSGRAFPTWSEVLAILKELGYEKS